MKKISRPLLAASSLFAILAIGLFSAFPPTAQSAEPADMKPNSTEPTSLQQQIVAAERQGLDALKAGNIDIFADHTADEAVFVDAHGPAGKAQVVKNVADFRLTDYSMDDVKFVSLSANSGLIVYKISEKGISHGKEFAAQAYISSIWAERSVQETGAR